jgi:RNA polymerase sigma-70 factor (ECF subfamily)
LPADLEQRFAALMKAEGAALTRLAASYARGSDDRDDLFQDIAVAIWQALPRFRGECLERTFLFRIAHNRGIAHIARRRPHMIESDENLELRDERPDPEQSLSAEQQRQRLLNAVLKLPVGYRQVVTLALEGMSYQEIGDILGITESNAGARLTRARQMLRRSLKGISYGT